MQINMINTEYNDDKDFVLPIILHSIVIIYSLIFFVRIRRNLSLFCPSGKMSCIGKYKRNVINLTTTTAIILYWTLLPISFKAMFAACKAFSVSTKNVLLIHTLYNNFSVEIFYIFCCMFVSRRELPSRQDTPRKTQFYLRKPHLEPRMPTLKRQTVAEPTTLVQRRRFLYVSNTSARKNNGQNSSSLQMENLPKNIVYVVTVEHLPSALHNLPNIDTF